jgi:hypothetical protein
VIGRHLAVPTLLLVAIALVPSDGAAQRYTRRSELDSLMRNYWVAAVAHDVEGLDSLIVGEQPRIVLGMFLEGSGAVTLSDAKQVRPRPAPPMRSRGDTLWRTYAIRNGDMPHKWVDYVARFERRCGRWRIASISSVESLW